MIFKFKIILSKTKVQPEKNVLSHNKKTTLERKIIYYATYDQDYLGISIIKYRSGFFLLKLLRFGFSNKELLDWKI